MKLKVQCPSRKTLIKVLNETGSPKELAKQIGVSRITIHVWMNKMGITKRITYG